MFRLGGSEASAKHTAMTQSTTMKRLQTKLKPTLPPSPNELDNDEWFWYEGKRIRRLAQRSLGDSEAEEEYDCGQLNLGAESPYSGGSSPSFFGDNRFTSSDLKTSTPQAHGKPSPATGERLAKEWEVAVTGQSDAVSPANDPGPAWKPGPSSRRGSTSGRRPNVSQRKKEADRDCGICFEYAVKPCRTLCCGKIFCGEHLDDWLHGPNASGLCPNCDAPCSLDQNTLSLISLTLHSPSSSTTELTDAGPPQHERFINPKHIPSPLSTSAPITHKRGNSSELKLMENPAGSRSTSLAMKQRSISPSSWRAAPATSSFASSQKYGSTPGAGPQAHIKSNSIVDRDCEAGWIGTPGSSPVNDSLTGGHATDAHHSKPKDIKLLFRKEDWQLPFLNSQPKSEFGTSSPSMWSGKSLQNSRPSAFDSFKSPVDTFGSIAHLATLVAVLMLIYVVVGR